jgi:chromosome segregation ATPase
VQFLEDTKRRFDDLTSQLQDTKSSIDSTGAKLSKQSDDISARQLQNSKLASSVLGVQAKKDELRGQLAARLQLLERARREVNDLRDRERNLRQQQANLRSAIQSSRQTVKDVKAAVAPQALFALQKEEDQLHRQLEQTVVPGFDGVSVCEADDLDPVYTEQINSVSLKIEKLKGRLAEARAKSDEINQRHQNAMTERRSKLEELMANNNRARAQIEANQCTVREAIRPYTRELELWQTKQRQALKSAEESQETLNDQRSAGEELLRECDQELNDLSAELARAAAEVEQQRAANDEKLRAIEKLQRDVNALQTEHLSADAEFVEAANKEISLRRRVVELKEPAAGQLSELAQKDEQFRQKIEDLTEKVRTQEQNAIAGPTDDVGTSPMNETEVQQSVEALERDVQTKREVLAVLRAQVERQEGTRRKIEAALDLITELDDEQTFMKMELKMLRTQFSETLRMLRVRKK